MGGMNAAILIKGSLALKIGGDDYVLEAEDAAYFDAAVQHSYRRRGAKQCTGIIVTVP